MDRWDTADSYESFMGRWSRGVARQFVDRLSLSPDLRWLDVGCGTGALLETIVELARPSYVAGVDLSEEFVQAARSRLGGEAEVLQGSGDALLFDDDSFDVVVSGLVLNFMPDQRRAVIEWNRVARPGGTVAAYVWDYAEGMQFLRYFWDSVVSLDPGALELDEGIRFGDTNPDHLVSLFTEAGLADVETGSVIVDTAFTSFEDFWSPLTKGQGPAPGYVARISEEEREVLASRLKGDLASNPTGEISLVARAWTVRGTAI